METKSFAIVFIEKVVFPEMPIGMSFNLSFIVVERQPKGIGFTRSSKPVESKIESLNPENEVYFNLEAIFPITVKQKSSKFIRIKVGILQETKEIISEFSFNIMDEKTENNCGIRTSKSIMTKPNKYYLTIYYRYAVIPQFLLDLEKPKEFFYNYSAITNKNDLINEIAANRPSAHKSKPPKPRQQKLCNLKDFERKNRQKKGKEFDNTSSYETEYTASSYSEENKAIKTEISKPLTPIRQQILSSPKVSSPSSVDTSEVDAMKLQESRKMSSSLASFRRASYTSISPFKTPQKPPKQLPLPNSPKDTPKLPLIPKNKPEAGLRQSRSTSLVAFRESKSNDSTSGFLNSIKSSPKHTEKKEDFKEEEENTEAKKVKSELKHQRKQLTKIALSQFKAYYSLVIFKTIALNTTFTQDVSNELFKPILDFKLLSIPHITEKELYDSISPLFQSIKLFLAKTTDIVSQFALIASLINFGLKISIEAEYYTSSHMLCMREIEQYVSQLVTQLSGFLYAPLISSITTDPMEFLSVPSLSNVSNQMQQFFHIAHKYSISTYVLRLIIKRTCEMADNMISSFLYQFSSSQTNQAMRDKNIQEFKTRIRKLEQLFVCFIPNIKVSFPSLMGVCEGKMPIEMGEPKSEFSFQDLRMSFLDDENRKIISY